MNFAVIGGDMRQVKLAELLSADGHNVTAFAIDKIRVSDGVRHCATVKEAAVEADCVILPLPVASREGMLSSPLSAGLHTVRETLSVLNAERLLLAGRVDQATSDAFESFGLSYIDYFEREELAVLNAVATAEGAIQLVMEETPATIWNAKILVVGFGRVGKLLSHRLRALNADVTVSARSAADLAWIRAYGYRAVNTNHLDGCLGDYDVIINTVPARIIGETLLREVKSECLCLDLASKPGGMDFTAASKLGLRAMWALSLPGEVAPYTSGAIIRDTVYNILRERGAAI